MNILESIDVTLTQTDICELIKKELNIQGYSITGDISINIDTITTGFGMNEHDQTVFKNITCKAIKIK